MKRIYLRIWIGKRVLMIIATKNGFSSKRKDRARLKILFGIEGKI